MLPYSTIAVNMKLFGTYHRLFHTFTSLRALILVVSFVPNQIQLNLIYTHTHTHTVLLYVWDIVHEHIHWIIHLEQKFLFWHFSFASKFSCYTHTTYNNNDNNSNIYRTTTEEPRWKSVERKTIFKIDPISALYVSLICSPHEKTHSVNKIVISMCATGTIPEWPKQSVFVWNRSVSVEIGIQTKLIRKKKKVQSNRNILYKNQWNIVW